MADIDISTYKAKRQPGSLSFLNTPLTYLISIDYNEEMVPRSITPLDVTFTTKESSRTYTAVNSKDIPQEDQELLSALFASLLRKELKVEVGQGQTRELNPEKDNYSDVFYLVESAIKGLKLRPLNEGDIVPPVR